MWAIIINLLIILMCVYAGYILGSYFTHKEPIGVLRIDQSDPDDEPYLFLELTTKLPALKHGDQVCFEVSTENYISQE